MSNQITKAEEIVPAPIKYCLYARKSTESEERQVLSIDSQIKEMLRMAEKENLQIVEIKKESHSAKAAGQRPVFNELIDDIRKQKFNGILTWAPDRVSRNAGDLGSVVDLMDQKLLFEIRTYGQTFVNSPNEKFLLMILCSQAKLENDNRGINVKRGLRTRVSMGLWPGKAPLGYLNQGRTDKRCEIIVDPLRGPVITELFEKVAYEKYSGRKLYHWLRYEKMFCTRGNKPMALSAIYHMIESPLYYGVFEFPKDSGNWFQGKHKPLISKELFEQANAHLKRKKIIHEHREFAFTKLITCGLCGSGVTAEEKYKQLRDGSTAKYIYYGCTRGKDKNCKNKYIREEELIQELLKIIDQVDINELGMRQKLEEEVARYNKFQGLVAANGKKQAVQTQGVDVRAYAKYLLQEGTMMEKRELLVNLKSKLVCLDKKITLLNP